MANLNLNKIFATAAFFVSLSSQVASAPVTYELDNTHTNIMWYANHFGFSNSVGQFMEYDSTIIYDDEAIEESSIDVTIKMASVMTGLPKFDAHLKNKDFFEVERFETAHFVSEKIIKTGENTGQVHGTLTLKNIKKPLILEATLNKVGKNPYTQRQTLGFFAKGIIKRDDYGITYAAPGIGNEVEVIIEGEAIVRGEE